MNFHDLLPCLCTHPVQRNDTVGAWLTEIGDTVSYSFVTYDKRSDEHLAIITMNRPEVLNAIHSPATEELTAIWDDYANDSSMWVAILTGAGDRAFTVGDDLKHSTTPPNFGPAGWGGLVTRFNLWKPVIAAVNGWALGGGLEIVLACDIAVASENARFGCPEARIGGTPSKVAQQLLRQLPRGERGTLRARASFIAEHVKAPALRLRGVHRGGGAADVHKGEPTSVAMGQDINWPIGLFCQNITD